MIGRTILLSAAVASSITVMAQSSGIRFIFPEFSKVYAEKSPWTSFQLGMGYDHDFNERITMGLDVLLDLRREESGLYVDIPYGGYTAQYILHDKFFSAQYRTAYSFSANDDGTHVYLGTFVGVRAFKQTAELFSVTDPNGYNDNGSFVQLAEGTKTLIPMGLRFGIRGTLEGGYADLYTQFGYVVGGGESVFTQAYLTGPEFDLASSSLTLGLAYGFGW